MFGSLLGNVKPSLSHLEIRIDSKFLIHTGSIEASFSSLAFGTEISVHQPKINQWFVITRWNFFRVRRWVRWHSFGCGLRKWIWRIGLFLGLLRHIRIKFLDWLAKEKNPWPRVQAVSNSIYLWDEEKMVNTIRDFNAWSRLNWQILLDLWEPFK